MFGGSEPTPYDLRFGIFGIPIRVHPMFWVISAVLGWSGFNRGGLPYVAIWVACVFVSIVIHELGHALTATAFGYRPHIVLHSFGGYAAYNPDHRYTHLKAILITFAGPLAGFIMFGIVLAVWKLLMMREIQTTPELVLTFDYLIWINLGWGLINLLPVQPLDGGQITREVGMWISPRKGFRVACWIGVIVGAGIGAWGILNQSLFLGIMFLLLAWENYQSVNRYDSGYYY